MTLAESVDLAHWAGIARGVAVEAGELLLDYQGRATIDRKGEYDLVTAADLAAEALCRERLLAAFPGSGYVGEEGARHDLAALWRWVVDPLDGTNNYANGIPMFCVSIALVRGGATQVGVVHAPRFGETFVAIRGGGATCNDAPIRVSDKTRLADAIVGTGFPYDKKTNPHNNLDHFATIVPHVRGIRRMGSAAIDLCWVAMGRLDGFWELRLNVWDVAAGALVVAEAGGLVTDFAGEPIGDPPRHVVAGSAAIHGELRRLLAQNPAWRETGAP